MAAKDCGSGVAARFVVDSGAVATALTGLIEPDAELGGAAAVLFNATSGKTGGFITTAFVGFATDFVGAGTAFFLSGAVLTAVAGCTSGAV